MKKIYSILILILASIIIFHTTTEKQNHQLSATYTRTTLYTENSSNQSNNENIVDLALFFGQSNMVGRDGKFDYEKEEKNTPIGIDDEIIENYQSYAYTKVKMPKGVAFEYRVLDENKLFDISTSNETTTYGENITYNNETGQLEQYEDGNILSLEESYGTNMIPYFAKTYYEKTGHKLVIVHAARGGQKIVYFLPKTDSENSKKIYIYEAMIKKYASAIEYLKSNNYQIRNQFYVVYQGESDMIKPIQEVEYYRKYMKVHNNLKNEFKDLSFGALVYPVREGRYAPELIYNMEQVHEDQYRLTEEEDIILGTDFVYNEYLNANKTLFCPTKDKSHDNDIHLHSAALSQVGKNIAISIVNSNKLKKDSTKGDMNKNGKIDLKDIITLIKKYLNTDSTNNQDITTGDINNNGKIDLKDIILLIKDYLKIN